MQSIPVATGLFLCDKLIVEHRTMKASPIGMFSTMAAESFPHVASPFSVFASLRDGLGRCRLRLVVDRLDPFEVVYEQENEYDFTDPLIDVRYHVRLYNIEFPEPGWYQFTLWADGEWVAQCPLRLRTWEEP